MTHMMEPQVLNPPDDAALVEAGVSGDRPGTPAFVQDRSCCLQTEARKMRISRIGHVHTVSQGDAKVLNHYK